MPYLTYHSQSTNNWVKAQEMPPPPTLHRVLACYKIGGFVYSMSREDAIEANYFWLNIPEAEKVEHTYVGLDR